MAWQGLNPISVLISILAQQVPRLTGVRCLVTLFWHVSSACQLGWRMACHLSKVQVLGGIVFLDDVTADAETVQLL